MTTTTARRIEQLQFERARVLAEAHNHEWAVCENALREYDLAYRESFWGDQTEFIGTYVPKNSDEIAANTRQAVEDGLYWPGPCRGIEAPAVDDDGVIVHTTGTGRLSWTVCPDGQVYAEVSRPWNAREGQSDAERRFADGCGVVLELHLFQDFGEQSREPGCEDHICVVPESASAWRNTSGKCPLQRHYQVAYNAAFALIGEDAAFIPVYLRGEEGRQNGYLGALADERDPIRVRAAEAYPAACRVDADGSAYATRTEREAVARAAMRWYESIIGETADDLAILRATIDARLAECHKGESR